MQFLRDFLVNRSQLLAVPAPASLHVLPWHVVLDEDLREKRSDIVEVLTRKHQNAILFDVGRDPKEADGQKDNF